MQPPAAFTWKMLLCTRYTGEKVTYSNKYLCTTVHFMSVQRMQRRSVARWQLPRRMEGLLPQFLLRHCTGTALVLHCGAALVVHSGNVGVVWWNILIWMIYSRPGPSSAASSQQGRRRGQQGDCARNNFIHTVSIWFIIIVMYLLLVILSSNIAWDVWVFVIRDRERLFENIVGVSMRNEFLNIIVLSN